MTRIPVGIALVVLLAGCTVSIGPSTAPGPTPTVDGSGTVVTVVEVVDGDTIDVRYPDGTLDTVRLLGVDTPEVHVEVSPGEFEGIPDTTAGRTWLERWGENASIYLETRIAGERVRLATDPLADRRGSYGRLLAYVSHNDTLLNRALLTEGYARLYDSTFAKRDDFAASENEARAADRGLWGFESNGTETPGQVSQSPIVLSD